MGRRSLFHYELDVAAVLEPKPTADASRPPAPAPSEQQCASFRRSPLIQYQFPPEHSDTTRLSQTGSFLPDSGRSRQRRKQLCCLSISHKQLQFIGACLVGGHPAAEALLHVSISEKVEHNAPNPKGPPIPRNEQCD